MNSDWIVGCSLASPLGAASPPSEAQLLEQARATIASQPAKTLALTNAHRKHYPAGVLTQERELLAIRALEQLGRRSEAKHRAQRFVARYPGSPHQRRFKALLAE